MMKHVFEKAIKHQLSMKVLLSDCSDKHESKTLIEANILRLLKVKIKKAGLIFLETNSKKVWIGSMKLIYRSDLIINDSIYEFFLLFFSFFAPKSSSFFCINC